MNISKLAVKASPRQELAGPIDIDPASFPDKPQRGGSPPTTIANIRHLLKANGITVAYNIISKKFSVRIPWVTTTVENAETAAMSHILSLAARVGMSTGLVPQFVEAIGDENAFNPAAEWMQSRPWDEVDRLPAICATLTPREDYPLQLRDILVRRWLISVVAAATLPTGFRNRGVLTLQGRQGLGKTSWGLRLVNDDALRQSLVKTDHHLDAGDKDSLLGAIDHLIVEIGELDSSLKRDIARLKGFLTSGTDKVRRPYAKSASEYQRRTVFYATVNNATFLMDDTGNTRFWTIPCVEIDHHHDIDMQQVYAQCLTLLKQGEPWFLLPEEEELLEQENARHRSFSLIGDLLEAVIDREGDPRGASYLTATEVLEIAGINYPTNAQARECGQLLREWFGEPFRVQGRTKWRVPLRSGADAPPASIQRGKSKYD